MGVEKQTSESDIEVLQRVCAAVSIRAARLAAAGIASIAKVCIVNLLFFIFFFSISGACRA